MLMSMKKVDSNEEDEEDDDDNDDNSEVGVIKGLLTLNLEAVFIRNNKISSSNSWSLLLFSMAVIGSACLLLVFSCEMIGTSLGIHIMFISVVLASAATSVPDTIISMRDAKKGNYNDAIANALGSNIFDICFALGFPLFLYCIIYGPINMDPETLAHTSQLRILLLIFTILAFFIYFVGSKMGRSKAFMLIGIYLLFTSYIVGTSLEAEWAITITDYLQSVYEFIKGG